ncbi:MAG: 3-dehydroquinate synthase family protein [Spirochaetota bacterium]
MEPPETGEENTTQRLVANYVLGPFQSRLVRSSVAGITEGADFVVADENTAPLLPTAPDMVLPAGEPNKTLATVEQVIAEFTRRKLSRSSAVLAFGGGVVCDLVGFAAASYMRGCSLILVPTTLLAMVDASLGGKTGCNYQDYKNLIGAFYPAREVRLTPELLATLPPREFQSGLAELFKHALLDDSDALWQGLERRAIPVLHAEPARWAAELEDLVLEAVQVKGRIVERDLYERGERAFLNLGHTYAHALEKVSGFACTHGEAVAWGIYQALCLSADLGYCEPDYAVQVEELLRSMGFVLELEQLCPVWFRTTPASVLLDRLLEAMELDKKRNDSGMIRLVLQRGRGQTFIQELPYDSVRTVLSRKAL